MNTTSVGGILKMNNVDLNDGLFEVLLIKKPKDLFPKDATLFVMCQVGGRVQPFLTL